MAELKPLRALLRLVLLSLWFGAQGIGSFLLDLVRLGPGRVLRVRTRSVRPAALCDNKYGTHEFYRLKNVRMKLHCVVNGSKDKPLMLFLHGFPECWYSWRFQMEHFSTDYRVVAVDMRGYGESDKPLRVQDYSIDILTNDVNELLDALGYASCVLVAHDWGGSVAWMYAMQHPERVDRLIVCNCPHPAAFEDHLTTCKSQLRKSWYMFFFQLPFFPVLINHLNDVSIIDFAFLSKDMGAKPGSFSDEDIEIYKYYMAEYNDLLGPINYYRARMRYRGPPTRAHRIRCPVLLVWGTRDGALEQRMAELSGNYIEDLTLRLVEGASHWVQQEEPEAVNGHMRKFLKDKAV